MKQWTQREATQGATASPDAVNDELRAQQSSITTLDRDQLPADYVDNSRLVAGALLRSYSSSQYPTGSGEQDTVRLLSGAVDSNAWLAVAHTNYPGGWVNVSTGSGILLQGWKGGHLHIEWAGNGYIMGGMADGANVALPKTPRYLNLRITANGVAIAEKRGPAYHEAFRVIGSSLVPQGDVTIRLQYRIVQPSEDDLLVTTGAKIVPQAHLWGMRYFVMGRWR